MAPSTWHFTKNFVLLLTTFLFLPFTTALAVLSTFYSLLFSLQKTPSLPPSLVVSGKHRRTVLVTGVSMSKGLCLARHFYLAGHRVIGADTHSLSCARASRALHAYYLLPKSQDGEDAIEEEDDPYPQALVQVVTAEKVDLWVSVSGVDTALQDAVAKDLIERHHPQCKVIQLGKREVGILHEKDAFISHTRHIGLPVPETEVVADKHAIMAYLRSHGGLSLQDPGRQTQYLVKPIGVDDVARFKQQPLPLRTDAETTAYVASLPVSSDAVDSATAKFIVQEFVPGRQEYCTHALIVNGRVRAFTACPSSSVLTHYAELVPRGGELWQTMLDFTTRQVEALGGSSNVSGHISFDFLVRDDKEGTGAEKGGVNLLPIECNPRVHTAVVLFNNTPELVSSYLSVSDPPAAVAASALKASEILYTQNPDRYYWLGQDIPDLVLYPLYLTLFAGTMAPNELIKSIRTFIGHVVSWKEGTFEVWDPWPFWWLYHVYWPVTLTGYLFKGRWSVGNVSTGKLFKAN